LKSPKGEEIHYFPVDTHDQALPRVDRSRVLHAGSVIIDPVLRNSFATTRVSWDHPEIPLAPPSVMNDVHGHLTVAVKRTLGKELAERVRFSDLKVLE
jgi:hypothetical protein